MKDKQLNWKVDEKKSNVSNERTTSQLRNPVAHKKLILWYYLGGVRQVRHIWEYFGDVYAELDRSGLKGELNFEDFFKRPNKNISNLWRNWRIPLITNPRWTSTFLRAFQWYFLSGTIIETALEVVNLSTYKTEINFNLSTIIISQSEQMKKDAESNLWWKHFCKGTVNYFFQLPYFHGIRITLKHQLERKHWRRQRKMIKAWRAEATHAHFVQADNRSQIENNENFGENRRMNFPSQN